MVYPIGGYFYFQNYVNGKLKFLRVTSMQGGISNTYIKPINAKISPNPVTSDSFITISFESPTQSNTNITVLSVDGRYLFKQIIPPGLASYEIEASKFSLGLNIVNVMNGTNVLETGKVIVY